MSQSPWSYFSLEELACHCGLCDESTAHNVNPVLMNHVQQLRTACGFALPISSAYRCNRHRTERDKVLPGTHHRGLAVDIQVSGKQAHQLLEAAMKMNCFTGIGIQQKGLHNRRFIHLDISNTHPRPWLWSY